MFVSKRKLSVKLGSPFPTFSWLLPKPLTTGLTRGGDIGGSSGISKSCMCYIWHEKYLVIIENDITIIFYQQEILQSNNSEYRVNWGKKAHRVITPPCYHCW